VPVQDDVASAAARTVDALIDAMGDARRAIRPSDILGCFRHCNYRGQGHDATGHTQT
jgi:hypothetical protein